MDLRQRVFYKVGFQWFMKNVLGTAIPVGGEGAENVPKKGAALIIGNHRCWLDPIFIAMIVKRPVNWAGVDFNFNIPVVKWFAEQAGVISLNIQGGRKSRVALKQAIDILEKKRAELVGIFPEGVSNFFNPSPDEKIIRFHTGFARIALEARVPIVPVAVVGLGEKLIADVPGALVGLFTPLEIAKHGAKMIIYDAVKVRVGKPFMLEKYYEQEVTKEMLREISNKAKGVMTGLYDGEYDVDKDYF